MQILLAIGFDGSRRLMSIKHLRLPGLEPGGPGGLSGTVVNRKASRWLASLGVSLDMKGEEETFPPIHLTTNPSRRLPPVQAFGRPTWRRDLDTAPKCLDAPSSKDLMRLGFQNRSEARLFTSRPSLTISGIRIQMPASAARRTVHLRVFAERRKRGERRVGRNGPDEHPSQSISKRFKDGTATIKCFAAKPCTIEAKTWLTKPGESAKAQVAASPPTDRGGNASVSAR